MTDCYDSKWIVTLVTLVYVARSLPQFLLATKLIGLLCLVSKIPLLIEFIYICSYILPPQLTALSFQFVLTPRTELKFDKINEEFDQMMKHNQLVCIHFFIRIPNSMLSLNIINFFYFQP